MKNQQTNNKNNNASGLALSKKRFEDTLNECSTHIQEMIKVILDDFNKTPKSHFENINFYCHTRLLLLQADCEIKLERKIQAIEERNSQELIESLTTTNNRFDSKRAFLIGSQCTLLLLLTIWLWPTASLESNNALAYQPLKISEDSLQYSIPDELTPDISTLSLTSQTNAIKNIYDEPFFLAHNTDESDSKLVQAEKPRVERWLEKIQQDTLRNNIYNNPNIKQKTLALGVIESILNPHEVSPAGALGAFQIMPGLDGVYGSPIVLKDAIAENPSCLPSFEKHRSNRATRKYHKFIEKQQSLGLLNFLKVEKRKRSPFWKQFTKQQRKIYVDMHCSQWLATKYMQSLEKGINTLPKRQVEYFSVMAYNMGLENSKRLISAMKNENLYIDPVTIINYVGDKKFKKKISNLIARQYPHYSKRFRKQEIKRTVSRMKEARVYLARYLTAKKLIQERPSKQQYYALAQTE